MSFCYLLGAINVNSLTFIAPVFILEIEVLTELQNPEFNLGYLTY